MAGSTIRPGATPRGPGFPPRNVPGWFRRASLFRQRRTPTRLEGSGRIADRNHGDPNAEPTARNDAHATCPFPLLNAYAASAVEIARHAGTLELGADALDLGPVAVQALVREVVTALQPQAQKADLTLLRDTDSRCDGVCCADPIQLRRVLAHLLLRALCMEQTPGHVRVIVTLTSHEAQILILSRTPEAMLAAHSDAARHDLIAPQRLLQAMGGSLVLEPRRGGYLPLCIALPAISAASALQAA